LHNCRGRIEPRVDAILPEAIDIAVGRLLNSCKSSGLKILLLETIANTLYYNPLLTLRVLEAKGLVTPVFTLWFQTIPKFKQFYDKKLIILGLAAIFGVRYNNLPPVIQQGSKQILETLIKLLGQTEEDRKDKELNKLDEEHSHQAKKDAESDDEEEYATDESLGFRDVPDEQDIEADDSDDEGMDMTMFASSWNKKALDGGAYLDDEDDDNEIADAEEGDDEDEDEDDEEEDDDDDDDSDDEEFFTFIDQVDELVFFATKLKEVYETEPQVYQGMVGALSQAEQQSMNSLIGTAQTRAATPK